MMSQEKHKGARWKGRPLYHGAHLFLHGQRGVVALQLPAWNLTCGGSDRRIAAPIPWRMMQRAGLGFPIATLIGMAPGPVAHPRRPLEAAVQTGHPASLFWRSVLVRALRAGGRRRSEWWPRGGWEAGQDVSPVTAATPGSPSAGQSKKRGMSVRGRCGVPAVVDPPGPPAPSGPDGATEQHY